MKKLIYIFILLISNLCYAMTDTELLKKIDEIQTLEKDGTAKVEIIEKNKELGTRKFSMIYYIQDKTDSFLIVFAHPEKDKGNGYLKRDENMWMYRKNTRTFQHINSSESIGGTNATADDFEKKDLYEEYNIAKDKNGKSNITDTKLGNIDAIKIVCIAKTEDVKDPKRIYWLRKSNYLPLKVQNFSLSGTLMETIYYKRYTKIDGVYIASKFLIIDEFDKGNKTLVNISEITISPIPNHVFTKAYLENLSK